MLDSVPPEIVLQIARWSNHADLKALRLSHSRLALLLTPICFQSLLIREYTTEKSTRLVSALSFLRSPTLAQCLKHIQINLSIYTSSDVVKEVVSLIPPGLESLLIVYTSLRADMVLLQWVMKKLRAAASPPSQLKLKLRWPESSDIDDMNCLQDANINELQLSFHADTDELAPLYPDQRLAQYVASLIETNPYLTKLSLFTTPDTTFADIFKYLDEGYKTNLSIVDLGHERLDSHRLVHVPHLRHFQADVINLSPRFWISCVRRGIYLKTLDISGINDELLSYLVHPNVCQSLTSLKISVPREMLKNDIENERLAKALWTDAMPQFGTNFRELSILGWKSRHWTFDNPLSHVVLPNLMTCGAYITIDISSSKTELVDLRKLLETVCYRPRMTHLSLTVHITSDFQNVDAWKWYLEDRVQRFIGQITECKFERCVLFPGSVLHVDLSLEGWWTARVLGLDYFFTSQGTWEKRQE